MIAALKTLVSQRKLKKDLLQFLAEIEKNLEKFYVMDQRQFIIDGFAMDVWPLVKDLDVIKKHEAITVYNRMLEDFNKALTAHKEYEKWYAGNVANKTPENARTLHTLKNDLDRRLVNLDSVIIPAGQALEGELLKMGLLSA